MMTEDHKPTLRREIHRITNRSICVKVTHPCKVTQTFFRNNISDKSLPESQVSKKALNVIITMSNLVLLKSHLNQETTIENGIDESASSCKSYIGERKTRSGRGPMAVFGPCGVSLTMTRSLGDR
jgi:hypothetical protein